jgi:hypothetical protein
MARHGAAACLHGAWGSWRRGWWEMGWRQRWRRADRGRSPSAAGTEGSGCFTARAGRRRGWVRSSAALTSGPREERGEETRGGIDLILLGLNLSWKGEKKESDHA